MQSKFSSEEKQIIEEISSDNLIQHLREIARYVRMSGSEEETKALQYVKKTLTAYGFRVREYRFDAYIGEPKSAELHILTPETKMIVGVTAALAPSTPKSGVEAEIVDVGAGTEAEFAKQDVRKACSREGTCRARNSETWRQSWFSRSGIYQRLQTSRRNCVGCLGNANTGNGTPASCHTMHLNKRTGWSISSATGRRR